MERLLASRDSRRRRRRGGAEDDADYEEENQEEQEDLKPMAYGDAWTQAREWGDSDRASRPAASGSSSPTSSVSSDYDDYDERDEDGDPQYEGWGSSGFSSARSGPSGEDGEAGRGQRWERVSGTPKPRRRPAARRFQEDEEGDSYGDRRMREASRGRGRNDREEDGLECGGRDDVGRSSSMASGRERDRG